MGIRTGASGLEAVLRLPAARERTHVTPSGATALLACMLRVAFQSEGKAKRQIGSPATRLGTVCHETLEQAAQGNLGPGSSPDWRESFEQAWVAAMERQQAQLAAIKLPRPWPSPERWPFYG